MGFVSDGMGGGYRTGRRIADTFDRPDSSNLDLWTEAGGSLMSISGNRMANAAATTSFANFNTPVSSIDQWAECDVNTGDTGEFAFLLRNGSTAANVQPYLYLGYAGAADTYYIIRYSGGGSTTLATAAGPTSLVGRVRAEVRGDLLRFFVNGKCVVVAKDTAPLTSGLYIGVRMGDAFSIDNFAAGSL